MSTQNDQATILNIIEAGPEWVHHYTIKDDPRLAHLSSAQLSGDIRKLRKSGTIKRKVSDRMTRDPGMKYKTYEYRLAVPAQANI